ncbi:UvrD-helicase domain-containing protein [Paenibacillus sp. FSL H8-237]|uniref:UvrD-helicase domain-containing protein n=1 Tax=Paenibacillus sp. FSL H8-237 TaxID=1227350 RepID=UPI001F474574|nr:UvrD-helicase domain-containing protein [Paenibacillus sp. FSL H8-237]
MLLAFNREAANEVSERLYEMIGEKAPQAMTFHALAYAIVHPEESLIYDDEIDGFMKSSTVQQVIDSFIHSKEWGNKIEELMLKYFREDWESIVGGGYHLSPEEMVIYRRSIPYIGLDGKYYKSMGEKRLADYLFEHDVPYSYEKNFWWGGMNYKPDFTIQLNNKSTKGIIIEYLGMTGDREYDKQTNQKREYWKENNDYYYIELYPNSIHSEDMLDQVVGTILQNYGVMNLKLTDLEIWYRIKTRAIDEFSLIVSQFISFCRKLMISPVDLIKMLDNQYDTLSSLKVEFLQVIWKIYNEYLEVIIINNQEDFDGLLIRSVEKINRGQSCWQRKKGSGDLKFVKYLFIDEYQDFSLQFYKLISAIRNINQDLKLFCVGDDWQAINGFAGSDLRFFTEFQLLFPNSKKLNLTSNYRSGKNIVSFGNELMYGYGAPSEAVVQHYGDVWVSKLNEFSPNNIEKNKYNGEALTPALIRLVYFFTRKGKRVALLCRRGSGLPWYTPYDSRKGKYHIDFLKAIRSVLPENQRTLVTNMATAHSYKGKEEEVIIIVDAVDRSYPILHPNNVFFEVLGRTMEMVVSEERRLLYVAASRAKESLVILTEKGKESPFLKTIQYIENLNINSLEPPKSEGSMYIVKITNSTLQKGGTFEIKSYLRENKYRWNPAEKAWIKHWAADKFTRETLLSEAWIKHATNVLITISDEFNNKLLEISITDGLATIKETC